jgi:hypothetical protein
MKKKDIFGVGASEWMYILGDVSNGLLLVVIVSSYRLELSRCSLEFWGHLLPQVGTSSIGVGNLDVWWWRQVAAQDQENCGICVWPHLARNMHAVQT